MNVVPTAVEASTARRLPPVRLLRLARLRRRADPRRLRRPAAIAAAIYAVAVSALLGTSALYHRVTWRPAARRWMRRLDHSMIFVLIAGTYTPVALLALQGSLATTVLIVVWAGALGGVVFKLVWIDAPKWLFALVYVALGWCRWRSSASCPRAIGWLGCRRARGRRAAVHRPARSCTQAGGRTRRRGCSATTRSSTRSCSPPPRCTTR